MDRRVVVAVIAGGDAVQVPPDVLHHRIEEPPVRVAGASAKEEMLEEVGDPVLLGLFVPRAGPDVGGEHAGVQMAELDGDDAQAVREDALVDRIVQMHLASGSGAATLIRSARSPPPPRSPGRRAPREREAAAR